MSTSRRTTAVALAAVAALALAACSGSSDAPETEGPTGTETSASAPAPAEGGTVDIAWPAQPPTLDPVFTTSTTTNFIAYNVFEGLVALDENYEVKPVLAQSWEANDDFTEFTFVIREDVAFHNGDTMDLGDVQASVERWIADTSAGTAYFADAVVSTSGDDTLTITVPETLYTGIYHLAQPTQQLVVMPAESVAAKGDDGVPLEDLVGTGPFQIESVVVDQAITLTRFADHAPAAGETSGVTGEKVAHADEIVFHIVPDATTRLTGIESGQYDYATDIPADNATQLENNPDVTLNTLNSGILALVFDKAEGPLANETLRQAVQAGLDVEAVMLATYGSDDYFTLNGALAGPEQSDWYTEAGLEGYAQNDPELARGLIEESGYAGEPIVFLTTRDYFYMYNAAVVVADELEELGLNVQLEVTDWSTILTKIYEPASFDMFITDFLKRPVPLAYTYFNSGYAGTTDDPALTEALGAVNAATSSDEGLAAMDALQEAHYRYVPVVKFGDIRSITAQRSSVEGFIPFIGPVFYGSYPVG